MSTLRLMATVASIVLLGMIATGNSQDGQQESTRTIKQMEKERLEASEEIVDIATHLNRRMRLVFDELYAARSLLLQAQVEMAETQTERVKFREQFVVSMKGDETFATKFFEETRFNRNEPLKARRLEAEIALLQAKND